MCGQCSRPPGKREGVGLSALPLPPHAHHTCTYAHTDHVTDASQNKHGKCCGVVVVNDQQEQSRRRHYSCQREEVGDRPYVLLQCHCRAHMYSNLKDPSSMQVILW